jgi:peptidylprolyl isomerase
MHKSLLSILVVVAVALGACGGGHNSTAPSPPESEAKPFRIPVGNVSIRDASDLDFKANGLVGPEPKPIIPSGPPPVSLAFQNLIEGVGPAAGLGTGITVQYAGVDYETGKKVDSSWDRGEPLSFKLGSGSVMEGWEQGIEGMEAGGRRELVVPPGLTFGGQRVKTGPPGSTLVFVIDLLGVEEGA